VHAGRNRGRALRVVQVGAIPNRYVTVTVNRARLNSHDS
jgi:hypothetical protein